MRLINALMAGLLLAGSGPVAAATAKHAAGKPAKALPARAAAPARPVALPDTPEVAALRQGFRFGFPIYEFMRTRNNQLARAGAIGLPNAVNMLFPRAVLADATSREVTTPNNDTLYASGWLDLAGGPVLLTVPALGGRYNSAALMSVQTDNTAILGTRTGGQGGRYAIVGPGYAGPTPAGTELIRSASNDAWLLVRVLVAGPGDLAAAAAALGGFKLEAAGSDTAVAAFKSATPAVPDAAAFRAVVDEAIARNPGLAARAAAFTGLAPGAEWARHLPGLRAELKGGLALAGDVVGGWSYPRAGIGDFGDDNDLRAYVALGGLAALPRVEAMYLSARADKDGTVLDGSRAYRVTLPPRLPVGAFWSLTMYQVEPDGRLFFVANPLNRFAVGDRSKQLRSNRDGSYEIFVQAGAPHGERVVNWLPAPKGKFVLVFRAYLPRAELLDGSFRLPPVVAAEVVP